MKFKKERMNFRRRLQDDFKKSLREFWKPTKEFIEKYDLNNRYFWGELELPRSLGTFEKFFLYHTIKKFDEHVFKVTERFMEIPTPVSIAKLPRILQNFQEPKFERNV